MIRALLKKHNFYRKVDFHLSGKFLIKKIATISNFKSQNKFFWGEMDYEITASPLIISL